MPIEGTAMSIRCLVGTVVLGLAPAAWGWSGYDQLPGLDEGPCAGPGVVTRFYQDTSTRLVPGRGILLQGTPAQVVRLSHLLDQVYEVPFGRDTLQAILETPHTVTLCHSTWALRSAGRTLAPLSRNLTNGVGESALVLFDTRIPAEGSHAVFNTFREPIPYTAVQNLYHELSHARHYVSGTWRYFDSEGQAIADENRFRAEAAGQAGLDRVAQRIGIRGDQVWWPEEPGPP